MRRLILAATLMLSAFDALATQFEEGVDYTKVGGLTATDAEVREYFSFYCPHCFKFESHLTEIKANLPEGAKFVRSHVDFLRMASPKMQRTLSRALIVAQKLEVEEKIVEQIFNYIHKYRAVFTSERDVRNVFVNAGVDGDKFDQLINQDDVVDEMQQMQVFQNTLAKKREITSVPTIVVNGKYRINTGELDHHIINQQLSELTNYLLSLEK